MNMVTKLHLSCFPGQSAPLLDRYMLGIGRTIMVSAAPFLDIVHLSWRDTSICQV